MTTKLRKEWIKYIYEAKETRPGDFSMPGSMFNTDLTHEVQIQLEFKVPLAWGGKVIQQ